MCYLSGMRATIVALVCVLTGLGSIAAASSGGNKTSKKVPTAKRAKRIYQVAAMGDSLTDPRSHGGKYLQVLRDRCPLSRFDAYGVGGNMVNQMRKRFARDVLGAKPRNTNKAKPVYSHVLVLGGINDICSDRTALRSNDKIERDLAAMYRMARAKGLAVVALTVPPWGGFKRYYNPRRAASTQRLNRWIRARRKAAEVDALLDVYPLLSCGDPELLCPRYGWPDKVHWNKAGHRVVGEALHRQIFADCG